MNTRSPEVMKLGLSDPVHEAPSGSIVWSARVFLHPDTGAPLQDERLQFSRNQFGTSKFYVQDVTDVMPLLWKLLVDAVLKSCLFFGRKLGTLYNTFLGWVSTHLHEDVDHETLWRLC